MVAARMEVEAAMAVGTGAEAIVAAGTAVVVVAGTAAVAVVVAAVAAESDWPARALSLQLGLCLVALGWLGNAVNETRAVMNCSENGLPTILSTSGGRVVPFGRIGRLAAVAQRDPAQAAVRLAVERRFGSYVCPLLSMAMSIASKRSATPRKARPWL
jgi:hypothetical protein